MSDQYTHPLETIPVKELAGRIQADPELAGELPLAENMPNPAAWNRRARFILETAVTIELDERRLVDDLPALANTPSSFSELGAGLDKVFDPRVAALLGEIHQSDEWEAFFWRSDRLILPSAWADDPLQAYTEIIGGQAGVMVSHVEGIAGAVHGKYNITGNKETADLLRRHMPYMWGKIGYLGLDAAQAVLEDLDNDRNNILRLDEDAGRLGFVKPLSLCPAGESGTATVQALDDAAREDNFEPIGCPAFIGSRLGRKLAHRAIDEADTARLLEAA